MTTHAPFLRAADIPPTAEQLQLLEYVRAHPRCLTGEAARALGWATWTVQNRMQSLYVKGLVERVRSDGAFWRWEVSAR